MDIASPPNFKKPWKLWQVLGKIKNILANLSENMLNSGHIIQSSILKIRAKFQLPHLPQKASASYAYAHSPPIFPIPA
jgi:hypothetical protein